MELVEVLLQYGADIHSKEMVRTASRIFLQSLLILVFVSGVRYLCTEHLGMVI